MIWRLSGWSSTTKMRLLIPFPPTVRLHLHRPNVETKTVLRSLPSRSPAMLLLHAFRVRRGVVHEVLKFSCFRERGRSRSRDKASRTEQTASRARPKCCSASFVVGRDQQADNLATNRLVFYYQ